MCIHWQKNAKRRRRKICIWQNFIPKCSYGNRESWEPAAGKSRSTCCIVNIEINVPLQSSSWFLYNMHCKGLHAGFPATLEIRENLENDFHIFQTGKTQGISEKSNNIRENSGNFRYTRKYQGKLRQFELLTLMNTLMIFQSFINCSNLGSVSFASAVDIDLDVSLLFGGLQRRRAAWPEIKADCLENSADHLLFLDPGVQ